MTLPHYAKHDLQFYEHGCGGTFELERLSALCVQRLQTLGLILRITERNEKKTVAEYREILGREIESKNIELFADLRDGIKHEENREAREMDNVSHNLLRLVLVQDDETRDWFLKTESILFRWRLEALDERGISAFKTVNAMTYPVLAAHDKKRLRVRIAPLMDDQQQYETTTFYEVSVFDVPELLEKRLVYLERGTAYITELQFRSLISYQFEHRLARMLELGMGAKYYVNDPRIDYLGERVRKVYDSLRETIRVGGAFEISVKDLKELSETSYPPCMRILHEALESRSHLRNGGRVQYTFFLKSMGIKAEDALEFYRNIFERKISPEAFQKEYAYQFRHMYGLVGAGKDYRNSECVRIAEEAHLGPNDCHGCFFANHDIEDLGRVLSRWKIPANHVREMARFAGTKEYGRGCAAYFQARHGIPVTSPIIRPDDFFRQSIKIVTVRRDVLTSANCFLDDEFPE